MAKAKKDKKKPEKSYLKKLQELTKALEGNPPGEGNK